MEGIPVKVVVVSLDSEARRIIGEGTRRYFYDVLKRNAANTPAGWVLLSEDEELYKLINDINSRVGRPVVAVVTSIIPQSLLYEWLQEYAKKLEQSLANYMTRIGPTSYMRRKEIEEALSKIRQLLGQEPVAIAVEGE